MFEVWRRLSPVDWLRKPACLSSTERNLIAGLVFATALSPLAPSVQAQVSSPNMVATNMPGVYAHTQPPAGFDPVAATAAALELYNYPPRPGPGDPVALAQWKKAADPSIPRIIPALVERSGHYNEQTTNLTFSAKNAASTSPNWSGYALTLPKGTSVPFYWVTGEWTVPFVQQAREVCTGGWDYSSQWVGIDGFSNNQLFQSGSAANVYCDPAAAPGVNATEYFPWIEWLPAPEVILYRKLTPPSLLAFAAGDLVSVTCWVTNFTGGVSKTGHLLFTDITQNWQVSLTISAAALGGSGVIGNSAEWIVERTQVNGSYATLPNYIADPWVYTSAKDFNSSTYYPGLPGRAAVYNITMLDQNKKPISDVDLFGSNALWFFPTGSAVNPP
jgi:Peptidase A4 family